MLIALVLRACLLLITGLLEGIISLARKAVDHVLNDDSAHGTKHYSHMAHAHAHAADSEQSRSQAASAAELMSRAIGALKLLNDALLGLASVRVTPPLLSISDTSTTTTAAKISSVRTPAPAEEKQCKRCGKTGTQMLRCSRCKGVHYCSKQHQAADWPEHKVSYLILKIFCVRRASASYFLHFYRCISVV